MILINGILCTLSPISLYIKKLKNEINFMKHEYNINIETSYKRSNMSPIKLLGEEI